MMYTVKEMYYTLQGEGAQTGRAAVFLRFAGCNLWSGREADRASAACQFCDTDFVGADGPAGGRFEDAGALAESVFRTWRRAGSGRRARPYVVITGGEPLLLPFTETTVPKIDLKAKQIVVVRPAEIEARDE